MRVSRGLSWCAWLALIGMGLAGYLTFIHLGLLRGELLGGPACSAGTFNCHAVTAGRWGAFLGMPLALWGLVGYVAVFALSLLGRQSAEAAAPAATLLFSLSAVFVGLDLALLGLMAFVIRYFCLFCLLTYAVNVSLLVVSARSLGVPRRAALGQLGAALGFLVPSRKRPAVEGFWGVMVLGVLGAAGVHAATTFVTRSSPAQIRQQIRGFVANQSRVRVEVAGDPAIGPADAPLQLVEFSDFFCPACQRASKLNTVILASHRQDVRFIFKHYPLDTACNDRIGRMVHAGACRVAAASECAHAQGKFWLFHDLLFESGHGYNLANLEGDAGRLGLDVMAFVACLDSGQGMEAVRRDIAQAAAFGVQSTPTYVLNGIAVGGGLSPSAFEEFAAVLRESR